MSNLSCMNRIKRNIKTNKRPSHFLNRVIKLIIDRSGSMELINKETINGTIDFIIEEQKNSKNKYSVDIEIVSFDNKTDILYNGDIQLINNDIIEKIKKGLKPRGLTSIYDSCCPCLDNLIKQNNNYKKLFVLITDGEDNSSKTFSFKCFKNKLKKFNTSDNSTSIFLAANIDAIQTGNNYGFSHDTSLQLGSNPQSAKQAMKCLRDVSKESMYNSKVSFTPLQRHVSNQQNS